MKQDKFSQLVEDLVSGDLTLKHIQIAVRASIRQRKDVPEGIKDLLAGRSETYGGLVLQMFKVIEQTMGSLELAYRRGKDYKK